MPETEAHVVTCFLRNRGEVLLVRRAEDASTYPGRWAAVSGYVECDDTDDDVRREVEEETGLVVGDASSPAADAHVLRRGEAFGVDDPDLGTRFVVHPYLLDATTRDVTTNDEISEYEWRSPTEIRRRETVPRLWGSYEAVAPDVDTLGDEDHGSSWLSVRALEVLRDTAATSTAEETRKTARALVGARPSMPVVGNRVARAASPLTTADAGNADEAVEGVERRAHEAVREAHRSDGRAVGRAAEYLGDTASVTTLSRSGTVAEMVRRVEPDSVTVLASEPGGEGEEFADTLRADLNAEVRVVPDSCAADAAEADAVVSGVDAVLPDGTVVNKIGTLPLALSADRRGTPFVAVASTDKISASDGYTNETVDRRGTDVPRFERVPADLVTLVTDEGALTDAEVRGISDRHSETLDSLS